MHRVGMLFMKCTQHSCKARIAVRLNRVCTNRLHLWLIFCKYPSFGKGGLAECDETKKERKPLRVHATFSHGLSVGRI